jgi:hypothetical protein
LVAPQLGIGRSQPRAGAVKGLGLAYNAVGTIHDVGAATAQQVGDLAANIAGAGDAAALVLGSLAVASAVVPGFDVLATPALAALSLGAVAAAEVFGVIALGAHTLAWAGGANNGDDVLLDEIGVLSGLGSGRVARGIAQRLSGLGAAAQKAAQSFIDSAGSFGMDRFLDQLRDTTLCPPAIR